jgi:hypothetical protein
VAKDDLLKGDFEMITDVNALPAAVLSALGAQPMANPGAKFTSTDVIPDPAVPQRRLILAGRSSDKCFVHYERGGRGLSYALEIFALRGESAQKLWSGYCAKSATSLDGLRSQIASGDCH